MDAKLYYFPGPASNRSAHPGSLSLDGVEHLPTEESMRAVSVALEALNRELDIAIAVGEDSLRRVKRKQRRARMRIRMNQEHVK